MIGPDWSRLRGPLAVFADEGDTAHADLYRQIARTLGAAQAEILLFLPRTGTSVLLDALLAGPSGPVTVVTCAALTPHPRRASLSAPTLAEGRAQIASRATALLGIPAGLGPVADLYQTWAGARDGGHALPVGLLNHRRAFEVARGFFGDIAAVGLPATEQLVHITESIDDLVARLARAQRQTVPAPHI